MLPKFAHCENCGGRMFVESDRFGLISTCINCGNSRDIPPEPKSLAEIDWTLIKNQWQQNREKI